MPSVFHFSYGKLMHLSNSPKHTMSELAESQIQTHPLSSHVLISPFAHAAFAIRICRPVWILSQLTILSHISHPSPAKSRRKLRRETWGITRLCPVPLTLRTWMWSRWNPNTHPRLTLSCLTPVTLHSEISVYAFKNTVVFTSWELKQQTILSGDVMPPESGQGREECNHFTQNWEQALSKC